MEKLKHLAVGQVSWVLGVGYIPGELTKIYKVEIVNHGALGGVPGNG